VAADAMPEHITVKATTKVKKGRRNAPWT